MKYILYIVMLVCLVNASQDNKKVFDNANKYLLIGQNVASMSIRYFEDKYEKSSALYACGFHEEYKKIRPTEEQEDEIFLKIMSKKFNEINSNDDHAFIYIRAFVKANVSGFLMAQKIYAQERAIKKPRYCDSLLSKRDRNNGFNKIN